MTVKPTSTTADRDWSDTTPGWRQAPKAFAGEPERPKPVQAARPRPSRLSYLDRFRRRSGAYPA